jgi:hypothetical protein
MPSFGRFFVGSSACGSVAQFVDARLRGIEWIANGGWQSKDLALKRLRDRRGSCVRNSSLLKPVDFDPDLGVDRCDIRRTEIRWLRCEIGHHSKRV